MTLTNYLLRLGFSDSTSGTDFIADAIAIMMENETSGRRITSYLYPEIGRRHGVGKWTNVERRIRHAIEAAWDRGDIAFQEEVFGYSINPDKGRPTNQQFLIRTFKYLKEEGGDNR